VPELTNGVVCPLGISDIAVGCTVGVLQLPKGEPEASQHIVTPSTRQEADKHGQNATFSPPQWAAVVDFVGRRALVQVTVTTEDGPSSQDVTFAYDQAVSLSLALSQAQATVALSSG